MADETRIDARERGAKGQVSERRLWMQLQVFGGCPDPKPLVRALEAGRVEAVLYRDVNDPRGVGLLTMHEDPAFFANGLRDLLNADPLDRKSTRLNSSHAELSRMPSSA